MPQSTVHCWVLILRVSSYLASYIESTGKMEFAPKMRDQDWSYSFLSLRCDLRSSRSLLSYLHSFDLLVELFKLYTVLMMQSISSIRKEAQLPPSLFMNKTPSLLFVANLLLPRCRAFSSVAYVSLQPTEHVIQR